MFLSSDQTTDSGVMCQLLGLEGRMYQAWFDQDISGRCLVFATRELKASLIKGGLMNANTRDLLTEMCMSSCMQECIYIYTYTYVYGYPSVAELEQTNNATSPNEYKASTFLAEGVQQTVLSSCIQCNNGLLESCNYAIVCEKTKPPSRRDCTHLNTIKLCSFGLWRERGCLAFYLTGEPGTTSV